MFYFFNAWITSSAKMMNKLPTAGERLMPTDAKEVDEIIFCP
jgi:hypothetical protein